MQRASVAVVCVCVRACVCVRVCVCVCVCVCVWECALFLSDLFISFRFHVVCVCGPHNRKRRTWLQRATFT